MSAANPKKTKLKRFKARCICLGVIEYPVRQTIPSQVELDDLVRQGEGNPSSQSAYLAKVKKSKTAFKPFGKATKIPKLAYKSVEEIRRREDDSGVVIVQYAKKKKAAIMLLKFQSADEVNKFVLLAKRKNPKVKIMITQPMKPADRDQLQSMTSTVEQMRNVHISTSSSSTSKESKKSSSYRRALSMSSLSTSRIARPESPSITMNTLLGGSAPELVFFDRACSPVMELLPVHEFQMWEKRSRRSSSTTSSSTTSAGQQDNGGYIPMVNAQAHSDVDARRRTASLRSISPSNMHFALMRVGSNLHAVTSVYSFEVPRTGKAKHVRSWSVDGSDSGRAWKTIEHERDSGLSKSSRQLSHLSPEPLNYYDDPESFYVSAHSRWP